MIGESPEPRKAPARTRVAPHGAVATTDAAEQGLAADPYAGGLNERIAERLRALRSARGWALEALAAEAGVSRSMISRIERGESSPTAVLLDRLAQALRVPLASLFEPADDPARALARQAEQPVWRDPGSGYRRRAVSPPLAAAPFQIVEVLFPPGQRIAYDHLPREHTVHQQVWVLQGAMEITLGAARHALQQGDCLAMTLNQPIAFHNPGTGTARYAVVLSRH